MGTEKEKLRERVEGYLAPDWRKRIEIKDYGDMVVLIVKDVLYSGELKELVNNFRVVLDSSKKPTLIVGEKWK